MVLGKGSTFRTFLNDLFFSQKIQSPLTCIPDICIEFVSNFEGKVEFIHGLEAPRYTPDECFQVGSVIALCTVLGISDLHFENVLMGSSKGRFVFAPIDIENLFDECLLPSVTLLSPGGHSFDHVCGLSEWQKRIHEKGIRGNIAALCKGYLETTNVLLSNVDKVAAAVLTYSKGFDSPIRCFLRSTPQYRSLISKQLDEGKLTIGLLDCERVQLLRGDIPYFWRTLKSDRLNFFKTPGEIEAINIEDVASKFILRFHSSIESWVHYLKINQSNIVKGGVLQLACRFADHCPGNVDVFENLTLESDRGRMNLKLNKMSLSCEMPNKTS